MKSWQDVVRVLLHGREVGAVDEAGAQVRARPEGPLRGHPGADGGHGARALARAAADLDQAAHSARRRHGHLEDRRRAELPARPQPGHHRTQLSTLQYSTYTLSNT